jgi:hypothetical protein
MCISIRSRKGRRDWRSLATVTAPDAKVKRAESLTHKNEVAGGLHAFSARLRIK